MNTPTIEEEEFIQWLKKNRMLFLFHSAHYTPDYMAWLARQNGFNPEMVYRKFSDFKYTLALSSPEIAAIKKTKWELSELLYHDDPIRLDDSWHALSKKLIDGKDFNE